MRNGQVVVTAILRPCCRLLQTAVKLVETRIDNIKAAQARTASEPQTKSKQQQEASASGTTVTGSESAVAETAEGTGSTATAQADGEGASSSAAADGMFFESYIIQFVRYFPLAVPA